ncbi:hypothetical protein [Pararhizobium sp. A13]|uniref:hypothetical protein n=1 Tax=Pararhizobium sp. A13 TaxID=3133975 RepID=UPI00324C73D5
MSKPEFTDYEKRLSADHERQCRALLTAQLIWRICRTRKCGRDRACTGPMLVSAHQGRKVRIQREIGLSGHACARLPACIANAQESGFQTFERIMDDFQKDQIAHPEYRLPKFDRCLKARQLRQDQSNP